MLTRPKKLFLSFFLSVFLLTNLSVSSVFAQDSTWYNQPYQDWYEKVYDTEQPTEIFGERYTHAQVQWIIYSLIAIVTGADDELQQCIAEKSGEGFTDIMGGCARQFGAAVCKATVANIPPEFAESPARKACELAAIPLEIADWITINNQPPENFSRNGLLATISTSPVSSVAYFKDIGQRLKFIPETQAQEAGFGFTAAAPVLKLWRVVRNLTYALLVIVLIAMAFMIMFRVKISPQTVITVQSALPRVILTLILITFSYAIAGFLIDLMYVVIGLIAGILTLNGEISGFRWDMMFNALTNRWIFSYMFLYWIWFVPALQAALWSSGVVGAAVGGLSLLLAPVILLLLAAILIIAMLRIMWLLLRTFVIILLLIIVGPIQILLGTFFGGGFTSWLRNIASHLAVYPTVGLMFVLSFIFLRGAFVQVEDAISNIPLIGQIMSENLLGPFFDEIFPLEIKQMFAGEGNWKPPLTFGSAGLELGYLGASFVIITMIPHAGNMIKSALQGKPFPMSSAIGQAVAAGGLTGMAAGMAERQALGRAAQRIGAPTGATPWWQRQIVRLAERRRAAEIREPTPKSPQVRRL